jgi:outer membrane protein assembly factor BamD (BamD/ComL family)
MARQRFRRKDLKRPDEFVSLGRQVLDWGTENARLLSWSAAAVAVLVLLVMGFVSIRNARVRQANEDLSHALGDFRDGRYAQAASQLADVASRWQSTAAGRIAGLYAANADLNANDFETATVLLQQVLSGRDWPPYLKQQALDDLGYALEHKGDAAGAAERYAEAGALQGPYTPQALLGEARCREQIGEKDKARQLYLQLQHDFPQSAEGEVAAAKLG